MTKLPDDNRLNGGHAMRLHVLADELDDVTHGRAWLKDSGYSDFFQAFDVLVRDNAAHQHQHVVHLVLLQKFHHPGNDGIVRTGENRESDNLNVFLKRCVHDHLWRLAEAGVDDLHAGIAQCASDDFGAAVMAVQTRLGDENADFLLSGHRVHLTTERAVSTEATRRPP